MSGVDALIDTATPAPRPPTGVLILEGEIVSLQARVEQRRPWSRPEISRLIEQAQKACSLWDVEAGRVIIARAEERLLQDVQTKNRMIYAGGIALGASVALIVALVVVAMASNQAANLTEPGTIIAIFAFAGIGSIVSFLTRLSSLDLRHESIQRLVVLSAAARPLIAIGFASIAYLILRYELINLTVRAGTNDPGAQNAVRCVAYFLCGFSERFGSDLLDRLPFHKPPGPNARPVSP